MKPFDFLKEEVESVRAALVETLRHDYGPEQSGPYFDECRIRLDTIEQAITDDPGMDRDTIAAHMRALSSLGSRISLIERSHLGEFSWPFAKIMRHISELLFKEEQIDGKYPPIVHIVTEGMDYKIVDDDVPNGGMNRIIIVAFPRQLKHHVLLHAIFGHELAHTAQNVEGPGLIMTTKVMPIFLKGPLQDAVQAEAWLRRDDAPEAVRNASIQRETASFNAAALTNWRIEIACDLFGLLLFGPPFAAAHRTIIEALCARPDAFELESSTHPPYPVRQRILARAVKHLGWDKPITNESDGAAHEAEKTFLAYITESSESDWFQILTDEQISNVLHEMKAIFEPHENIAFQPLDPRIVVELIDRLSLERPPIYQSIDKNGIATNESISIHHILYAGWAFWFGRAPLHQRAARQDPLNQELTFLKLNRLCDYAMLQQQAIDIVNESVK